jgi:hypothetical protein
MVRMTARQVACQQRFATARRACLPQSDPNTTFLPVSQIAAAKRRGNEFSK